MTEHAHGVPDAQAHWQVLTSCTRTGQARGEKVLLVLDPVDDGALARLDTDMAWGARTGVSDDQLLDYEACMEPLFVDPRLTAMCWYSRYQYTDHLVAAMRTVHPLRVMAHLDALEVTPADGSSPLRYALDLTNLTYMEAQTAWQLIGFARGLPDGDTLDVRCGPIPEAVLRGLGSDDVRQLRLRTVDVEAGAAAALEGEPVSAAESEAEAGSGTVSGTGR
ncbi:hypothetical protein GCM10023084_06240 [Streptomyces lacrimifluminis]|uniref:MEDS domain-containing protein n=1 Tax=Streptomyces lacrimifluminis TaxID=1500077 RepID=A0A917KRH5_9ACTN|nr:MEDS domain-containing protein [Streptomyces lacrimifluminis]GGJ23462.1 hypothetical protein GCM10012282_19980 [Streptomyces lacrimifluminis]